MRPAFGDDTIHQQHNLRVSWDRVVAMRREDDNPRLSHLRKELKDRTLSLRVQTCYRLIQVNHRGILIDEPRQGQALPLSSGEIRLSTESCSDQGIDPVL